ncbi:hypothetical protein [Paenibacillus sp. JDR-2]|nr:hypothetical protein [Paenibacillus sp. JDR-2]
MAEKAKMIVDKDFIIGDVDDRLYGSSAALVHTILSNILSWNMMT